MVLVTVWKLKEKAYSVPIREYLRKITGKRWSFGSIYNPLNRLEQKGRTQQKDLSCYPRRTGGYYDTLGNTGIPMGSRS